MYLVPVRWCGVSTLHRNATGSRMHPLLLDMSILKRVVAAPVTESAAAAVAARVPPAAPAVPTPVPTASELFKRAGPLQQGHMVKPYSAWTSSHDYGRVGTPSTGAGWRQTRLQVLPASSDDAASRARVSAALTEFAEANFGAECRELHGDFFGAAT